MKKIYINYILGCILLCVSAMSCRKADASNTEFMFKQLSDGSGIWEITAIEDWIIDSDGERIQDSIQTNPPGYYQFYLRTEIVGGAVIENPYTEIVVGTEDQFLAYRYLTEAEYPRLRLTFGLQTFAVFTVEEHSKNKLVLTRFTPQNTGETLQRIIRLKRCNSCKPFGFGFANTQG